MTKSITQDIQTDKQISDSIDRFFKRFRVATVLKSANAYKKKGFSTVGIFQYLFLLIFTNKSMYMNLLIGKNIPDFAKDVAYRFMKMSHINWIRFTTLLTAVIIKDAIEPLTSDERTNALIVDDSLVARDRSKRVELLTKVFDHARKTYHRGFRMLTLGWSDGIHFFRLIAFCFPLKSKRAELMKCQR